MKELDLDLSITISAIIALAAVISPVITTVINNFHQLKIKKIELNQQHYEKTVLYQREIFENYLRETGKYVGSKGIDQNAAKEYSKTYLVAYLHAPKYLQEEMKRTNECITHTVKGDANLIHNVEHLISKIQEYLQSL